MRNYAVPVSGDAQPEPDRLSLPGRAARLGLVTALLVTLLISQLGRHDDWFPLGMLGQYGVARNPDGEVLDTYLLGETADGNVEELTLRADVTGITRVELEIALPEMLEDPGLLEVLAQTYETNHPGSDIIALEVRQQVHTLRGGARSGAAEDRFVLRWDQ